MKLQEASKNNTGLTLIEILVVMGIIGILFVVGSFADISSIGRSSITAEQATLVSVLQKARGRAMNNIDASAHGVRVVSDAFILFNTTSLAEEEIVRNSNIIPSGLVEIVFEQLSGKVEDYDEDDDTMTLTQDASTRTVRILENGLIDW